MTARGCFATVPRMGNSWLPSPSLPPRPTGVEAIVENDDYLVVTWQNVMIQHVRGAIDLAFLRACLAAHHAVVERSPGGYGVITSVAPTARIPGGDVRAEAGRLREKTQHLLKAQSVLIGGEGFFAGTMRAVITGIVTMAKSRVPLKMVGTEIDAATFVAERVLARSGDGRHLADVLVALR